MSTLYLECNMGAAGDMLMAALMELCPEPDKFIEKMNAIGIKNAEIRAVKTEKRGILGSGIDVVIDGVVEEVEDDSEHHHGHERNNHAHEHHNHHEYNDEHHHGHKHNHNHKHSHGHAHTHSHSSLGDIIELIRSLDIPETVKIKACEVYSLLADAESHAHGKPVGHVHFHEVGALDAVCDIVGCCLALDIIAPDKVIVSPIHVGSGNVKCQHGVLPVPAPATAYILRGVPVYGGEVKGELCTPTGAALLKLFAHTFGAMPVMNIEKIGYGMGKKDFGRLNCVRAFLGESIKNEGEIYEISCNLDDITAEELAFSYDILFEAGALEVFAVPVVMKKGRAGHILTALAYEKDKESVAKAMLRHTTTRGVRLSLCDRMTLDYRHEKVETGYGSITIKVSSGYGITKAKPEYDSVTAAAKEHSATFAEVRKSALYAFNKGE
jgi:uncharacterized protein (TIGR00299 family) protein